MKNKIFVFAALAALCSFADTALYSTWLGYNSLLNATPEYSEFLGAYAGAFSENVTRSEMIGVYGGGESSDLYSVFGAGFRSVYNSAHLCDVAAIGRSSARNSYALTNCFFVGNYSGSNITNKHNVIDICGLFSVDGSADSWSIGPKTNASENGEISYNGGVLSVNADSIVISANNIRYENPIGESFEKEASAADSFGADVFLSDTYGSDTNSGVSATSPVRSLSRARDVAVELYSANPLTFSNGVKVAVYEGRYYMCGFNTIITNGITFKSVGRSRNTILTSGEKVNGLYEPLQNISYIGSATKYDIAGFPVSFVGFRISEIDGTCYNRHVPFAGIHFYDCTFSENRFVVRRGFFPLFSLCSLTRCKVHDNIVLSTDTSQAVYCLCERSGWCFSEISDNDFSYCQFLFYLSSFEHSLIKNNFLVSYGTTFSSATAIVDEYDNPAIIEYGSVGDIYASSYSNTFIVASCGKLEHRGIAYGFGMVTNGDYVAYCAAQTANLTDYYVAADESCASVRDDGLPDYGWRTSAYGAYKFARRIAKEYSDPKPNVSIKDSSTGETYLIKVVDGKLKLYSVTD